MHILITGHTGFKGSWMTILLKELGHQVSGLSLPPKHGSLFEVAEISSEMKSSNYCNILNFKDLNVHISKLKPDFIIHFAAQSLVIEGFKNPKNTFETNFNGTLNILDCAVNASIPILVITTDKVYSPKFGNGPFQESSPLGGLDPYSSSKSAADILTQTYQNIFSQINISIARAGNVIGGGDWSSDRLIPDLMRNFNNNKSTYVGMPKAIRPWQHVLDCLWGYYKIIQVMQDSHENIIINIGPDQNSIHPVSDVVERITEKLGDRIVWEIQENQIYSETDILTLDNRLAKSKLKWTNKLNFQESIDWTVEWYVDFYKEMNAKMLLRNNISNYLALLNSSN